MQHLARSWRIVSQFDISYQCRFEGRCRVRPGSHHTSYSLDLRACLLTVAFACAAVVGEEVSVSSWRCPARNTGGSLRDRSRSPVLRGRAGPLSKESTTGAAM